MLLLSLTEVQYISEYNYTLVVTINEHSIFYDTLYLLIIMFVHISLRLNNPWGGGASAIMGEWKLVKFSISFVARFLFQL